MKHKKCFLFLLVLVVASLGVNVLAAWPGFDQVQASAYIVMDAGSGDILVEQNIDEQRSIASITKIVTCMTILNLPEYDPDRTLLASAEAVTLASPESVRVGLVAGEEISTRDALIALMVMSANDAANVLAENYSGSTGTYEEKIAAFSEKMNEYARSQGAHSSNFNNPSGFDVPGHLSTARDVAILTGFAMQDETFRELVSTRFASLEPTNMHTNSDWALIRNSNRLVQFGADVYDSEYFSDYDGGKTGTTPQAGYCLMTSGLMPDGHRLIGVLLNATLIADGRAVDISIPMRALLEEGGRIYREANPIVETETPTVPATVPETIAETAPVNTEPAVTMATEIVDADEPGSIFGGDPMLVFVLGGVGVLLAVILFYVLLEMRRKRKMRRRRQAARALREMQDIRDTWRKPPSR